MRRNDVHAALSSEAHVRLERGLAAVAAWAASNPAAYAGHWLIPDGQELPLSCIGVKDTLLSKDLTSAVRAAAGIGERLAVVPVHFSLVELQAVLTEVAAATAEEPLAVASAAIDVRENRVRVRLAACTSLPRRLQASANQGLLVVDPPVRSATVQSGGAAADSGAHRRRRARLFQ